MLPGFVHGAPRAGGEGISGTYAGLRSEEGSQLIEFALVLPMLAVLVVAVGDFGAGFALKDKLTNAAREGARIAVSLPNDTSNPQCSGGTPCPVEAAGSAVVNYLANAFVNTCGLSPSTTGPNAGPGAFTWTYTSGTPSGCPAAWSIKIERAVPVTVNGSANLCTRVTISYPFRSSFGKAVQLLLPGTTYASTVTLQTQVTMQNRN